MDRELLPSELTVIIVSYNTKELTLKALETLFATTRTTQFNVIVYDNASEDGSAEAIAAHFPTVKLIASEKNIGFAGANNEVAKLVTTEWLLLLNPDTECHEGAVDRLLAFGKAHPQAGIYGGRTVFPDGSLNIASCWNRITPWSLFCAAFGLSALFCKNRFFNPEALGGWKRDSVRKVDIVVGCFLLIRRSLWEELDGFRTRYFMYGEEADLCLRARAKGYHPMITPQAQIMHLVGAASAKRTDKVMRVAKAKATLLNDHWPAYQRPIGRIFLLLWAFNRYSASRILDRVRALKSAGSVNSKSDHWAIIWQNRSDWLFGYDTEKDTREH